MDSEEQRRLEQLTIAVEHRSIIGMALGILMERHNLGAEEPFRRLRRVSSLHNRKLYDIACDFIISRALPPGPTDPGPTLEVVELPGERPYPSASPRVVPVTSELVDPALYPVNHVIHISV